jgi:predicted ATPase
MSVQYRAGLNDRPTTWRADADKCKASRVKAFISYRREDAAGHAGRLADHLAARFGSSEVFIDVSSIDAGRDFAEAIEQAIEASDVTLVVIGPSWTSAADGRGNRRLWDPADPVRVEVETALSCGTRTIPVLVGGSSMPDAASVPDAVRPLIRLNAVELLDRRWAGDVVGLVNLMERRGGGPGLGWLPASISSFVGREGLMADAMETLAATRLLTLIGPGGVGKTRLGLEMATAWRGDGRPAWFAALTPVRHAGGVAEVVLTALGVSARGEEGVDAAVRLLRLYPGLLVIDNCEHVLDAASDLVAMLLAGTSEQRVIATSREPLGLEGERTIGVPPLGLPLARVGADEASAHEAIRMFADRASAAGEFALTDENAGAVAEICRQVAGLPLGIELAAALVRSLSPEDIAARLSAHQELLSGKQRGHHATITSAIDWSVDLLEPSERRLFERLAIFEAPFPLEGAEAVAEDRDAARDVSALVDKSLLVMDRTEAGTVYRYLEPIRLRAETLLTAGNQLEAAERAHAWWIANLAHEAEERLRGPDQAVCFASLVASLPDVRKALALELELTGGPGHRVSLVGDLWWFAATLDAAEWTSETDRVLASADRTDPGLPQLIAAAAVQSLFTMDLQRAQALGHEVLSIAPRPSLAGMIASTTIGSAQRELGELDAALARHREDIAVAHQSSLPWWEMRARYSCGLVLLARGELPAAREELETGHRMAIHIGDPSSVIDCLKAIYDAAYLDGSVAEAESAIERMIPWVDTAMPEEQAYVSLCRAEMSLARGSVDAALEFAMHAGERSMLLGHAIDLTAMALEVVAACLARMERLDEAVRLVAAGESFLPMHKRFAVESPGLDRERLLVDLRLAMGAEAFAAAWSEGSEARFEDLFATL